MNQYYQTPGLEVINVDLDNSILESSLDASRKDYIHAEGWED